ncbi:MAG TPA: bifunctional hydroxymethylpyrimidine kinase/phosphomethylpyrimidine kinase [Candidatus Angelobacter sp.]|nr:bifunctional hydroxymethylpyrimidine kinase/phosphomethylpyrimidine kinase [Candidatus Angelobacter sp.]
MAPPIVLSIAGYDPSSGAGITADIKTIAAHGCYGLTCITALTVQSTLGVRRVVPMSGKIITATLKELAGDCHIDAVKIGMLGSAEAARAVAAFLKVRRLKAVVLDPVLISSSGARLLTREGVQILKTQLLKLASVITPNIDEAAALSGIPIHTTDDMHAAALRLHQFGVPNVIITGGHLNPPVDFLSMDSGAQTKLFTGKKISTSSTHGTGCAFSSALACNLAQGLDMASATKSAKEYVRAALKSAPKIGKGKGPVGTVFRRV